MAVYVAPPPKSSAPMAFKNGRSYFPKLASLLDLEVLPKRQWRCRALHAKRRAFFAPGRRSESLVGLS
jgi:hypothetical protein